MLKNSDIILTVSKSSMHELERFYDIGRGKNNKNLGINATKGILLKNINWNNNDIAIVGTGIDIDLLNAAIQSKKKIIKKKDIDFL